jgi:putative hydrolase of HD superfamily
MSKLINFFYEMGSLRKIMRAHRQTLLTDDASDNIAAHSFRVAVIGYFLAKLAGVDTGKVMLMCLLHDSGEARSGDQNWVHKKYVKVFEDEILHDQLHSLTEDNEAFAVATEYAERQSLESKIAKDADLLDQALLVQEYILNGNIEAKDWAGEHKLKELNLDISRELYKEIITTSPTDWWDKLWTNKRR